VYGNWIVLPEDLFSLRELDNRNRMPSRPGKWRFGHDLWYTLKAASGTASRCRAASRWPIRGHGFLRGPGEACQGRGSLYLRVLGTRRDEGTRAPDPSEAGEAAAKAGAKRLVLTHFYPECNGVDIEAQCRKTWQGPLTLARI